MSKPFMTYEQQIAKLRDEKELAIPNELYAKKMLMQNSYFALITGYKLLFKDKILENIGKVFSLRIL